MSPRVSLIETITSTDPSRRDRPVRELIAGATTDEILRACVELEAFRRRSENLYERVRARLALLALGRARWMNFSECK